MCCEKLCKVLCNEKKNNVPYFAGSAIIVERVVPVPDIEYRVAAMIDPKLNFNEESKADAIIIEGELDEGKE